jgi:hypothetical protein
MRRIALCLYGLCLVVPMIGCKSEEKAAEPAKTETTPATTEEAPK